jgi:hypothetical protein
MASTSTAATTVDDVSTPYQMLKIESTEIDPFAHSDDEAEVDDMGRKFSVVEDIPEDEEDLRSCGIDERSAFSRKYILSRFPSQECWTQPKTDAGLIARLKSSWEQYARKRRHRTAFKAVKDFKEFKETAERGGKKGVGKRSLGFSEMFSRMREQAPLGTHV